MVKKTKTMKFSKFPPGILNITMERGIVEQVKKFRYLWVWIKTEGKNRGENPDSNAKDAYRRQPELFKRNMSLTLKKKIVKALVGSVALY